MINRKAYTFAAGPCIFPIDVLNKVKNNLLNFENNNISIFDITKNSNHYTTLENNLKNNLKEVLEIPNNFDILFMQGGATSQFSMIPLNLLKKNEFGRYLITGSWSQKSYKEALNIKNAESVYNWGKDEKMNKIPKDYNKIESNDSKYLYYCDNETIQGVEFKEPPFVENNYLVTDMTSNFMSKKINFEKYGLIYAGAQKNFGPSGLSIVLIRKDLYSDPEDYPLVYNYKNNKINNSKYISPPIFSMYFTKLYIDWVINNGGLEKINELAIKKSNVLYDLIDNSNNFYNCPTEINSRSRMNIPFIIRNNDKDLTDKFLKESTNEGLLELKGYRTVGGMRASIYNGMPLEGVKKLSEFMISFKKKYE